MSEADSGRFKTVRAAGTTFGVLGLAVASWAARIPQVKSQLGLSSSQLGLLLLALAGGAMVTLPVAGRVVSHWGSRQTVRFGGLVAGCGLLIVALGVRGNVSVTVIGLVITGLAVGLIEIAMNVQGASVERRERRPIMSRFHGTYSIGTVVGAFLGVAMILAGVSVTVDLAAVAVFVPAALWAESRHYIHDTHDVDPADAATVVRHVDIWRERRTLLLGVMVFAFALAEGTGTDWIGVSMVQGHHTAPAIGTAVYGLFITASTAARWVGPWVLNRWGRVVAIRALGTATIVGLLLFTLTPWVAPAFLGAAIWGAGLALGFPVGMSAGSDEPALAAARVGVITSIGYIAFMGGPPLIGLLASWLGLPHALWVDILPLVPAIIVARVAAPVRSGGGRPVTASP